MAEVGNAHEELGETDLALDLITHVAMHGTHPRVPRKIVFPQ